MPVGKRYRFRLRPTGVIYAVDAKDAADKLGRSVMRGEMFELVHDANWDDSNKRWVPIHGGQTQAGSEDPADTGGAGDFYGPPEPGPAQGPRRGHGMPELSNEVQAGQQDRDVSQGSVEYD